MKIEIRPMQIHSDLQNLLDVIFSAGGRPIIVGGAVRDHLVGKNPKDIDIEVFDLHLERLESVLSSKFKVDAVGRSFGVLKVIVTKDTGAFDVALPRKENKEGKGHKGFVVSSDPFMTFENAAARRDFTINAIGFDPKKDEFLDPHGGIEDLKNGVLRHVSDAFREDPLRVFRACQFAARFELKIVPETVTFCRELQVELSTLAVERLWEEWKKLLLKSTKPSIGLEALRTTGALILFPELEAMIGVPQDPEWHPEGDCWVHNCMVVDGAARVIRDDELESEEECLIAMLGALCHDFGKTSTTEFVDGRWRAHGHEAQGEAPTRSFLARIACPPGIIEAIVPLVQHHLKPFHLFRDKSSSSAIRRLAVKVPLERLCRVSRADFLGRTTQDALEIEDSRKIEGINWFLDRAGELKINKEGPKPLLMGRHLIAMGFEPGKDMGKKLKMAFEAQLDGVFSDENEALCWAKDNLTV